MKTSVTIIGARPQFIKAAALSHELARTGGLRDRIVHSGQHYDPEMSSRFFEELAIPRLGHYGLSTRDTEHLVAKAQASSSMAGNPIVLTQEELAQTLESAL